jgi:cobalamin biosynthesis protein CobT
MSSNLHGAFSSFATRQFNADRASSVAFFEGEISKPPTAMGATRAALGQMLRSLDLVGWSRNEESGRLDRKALTRLSAGATTVFSRRTTKVADKSAVTVLVDCSGSMATEMVMAASATIQLAKMLEQARVSVRVIGFTGSDPDTGEGYDSDTGTDEQVLVIVPFKDRGETLRAAAAKMGAIRNCASAGTPDYAAIMHGIEELATQPESRKVLFFLTDAGSYDKKHIAQAQKFADRMGVTVIAIGIGCNVTRLFKHGANVGNIADLGGSTFTALLRTLKAKD